MKDRPGFWSKNNLSYSSFAGSCTYDSYMLLELVFPGLFIIYFFIVFFLLYCTQDSLRIFRHKLSYS